MIVHLLHARNGVFSDALAPDTPLTAWAFEPHRIESGAPFRMRITVIGVQVEPPSRGSNRIGKPPVQRIEDAAFVTDYCPLIGRISVTGQ